MGGFNDPEIARKAGQSKGKHTKTKQWDTLAESIVTEHADRFNEVLKSLPDADFAKIYKDILNYFKPKINHNINEQTEPTHIIFNNISKSHKLDENGNVIKKK